jgi:hypothetical protein
VGLEPTNAIKRHLFSKQAPYPAGWFPHTIFFLTPVAMGCQCESWNRTNTTTFRASRPAIRRSRKTIFSSQPPYQTPTSYQAPHRGIEPRPTVSKTVMHPSHPQGKSCRALNGFIDPGCVVQARRALTIRRTEQHSRKASRADGELKAVALPTANQPTQNPEGKAGFEPARGCLTGTCSDL